jgi:hypothetical protein
MSYAHSASIVMYSSAQLLHVPFNSTAYCAVVTYGTVATIDPARQNKQWELDTARSFIRSYAPAGSALLFLGMFARREESRQAR